MNPDPLKIIAEVLAGIVSIPVILAAVRAFIFFGRALKSMERVELDVKESADRVTVFAERITKLYEDHEIRLTTIEAERRMEDRYRRASDRPLDDVRHP